MSRLTIDITDQQHQTLKAIAALQGKTIKEYTLARLFPQASSDENAFLELKHLLEIRLQEAIRGEVSNKSITQIANEAISDNGA
jgi:Antitoxin ParD